jgi:hypothetical protein
VAFSPLFADVRDGRDANKVIYPLPSLLFVGVLLFLCRLGSRRQVRWQLQTGLADEKFRELFGICTIPHGDTLNDAFVKLTVEDVQTVVSNLVRTLIRKKILDDWRLLDRWFVIAIDGTGNLSFSTRHCEQCLTKRHASGATTYYHPVVEAKLVTSNGFAFSILTEFVENPGVNPTKQDCELKAFQRLATRLKAAFPRTPFVLSLDGLYACGPLFRRCEDYGWHWVVVLKDKDLPSVEQEFEALSAVSGANRLVVHTGRGAATHQRFRWVNDIAYTDTDRHDHVLSVLECVETSPGDGGALVTKTFKWVTDLRITKNTVQPIAGDGGRMRWKIENEGFNVQKNGGFALEHVYSENPIAAKVFYLLLQLAHGIAQLLEKGSLLRRLVPGGFGSNRNLAAALLEAWRTAPAALAAAYGWLLEPFQLRFDSS